LNDSVVPVHNEVAGFIVSKARQYLNKGPKQ